VVDPTTTVSLLIDGEMKWWRQLLLEQIFPREEIITIQSIPMSNELGGCAHLEEYGKRGVLDEECLSPPKRPWHIWRKDFLEPAATTFGVHYGNPISRMWKRTFNGLYVMIYSQLEIIYVVERYS
jgi:hypothetical protein